MSNKKGVKNARSDISQRRSIRVVAEQDYGVKGTVLKWMLRSQGRFTGEGSSFPIADAYKQYEHVTQSGHGESYDPEFFEGFIFTPELYEKAKRERSDYFRQERNRKAKESDLYWEKIKAEQMQPMTPESPTRSNGLLQRLFGIFK